MRLWSYQLLDCLDDFHIVSQWRELLAIKGAIDKNGTPNHRLVNKVLNYGIEDFKTYSIIVCVELDKRNIKYSKAKKNEILEWKNCSFKNIIKREGLYAGWHENRYLLQNAFNLQEKHDCGIVSDSAWERISNRVCDIMGEKYRLW